MHSNIVLKLCLLNCLFELLFSGRNYNGSRLSINIFRISWLWKPLLKIQPPKNASVFLEAYSSAAVRLPFPAFCKMKAVEKWSFGILLEPYWCCRALKELSPCHTTGMAPSAALRNSTNQSQSYSDCRLKHCLRDNTVKTYKVYVHIFGYMSLSASICAT